MLPACGATKAAMRALYAINGEFLQPLRAGRAPLSGLRTMERNTYVVIAGNRDRIDAVVPRGRSLVCRMDRWWTTA